MNYKVVKPFPFSVDGITCVGLKIGDERNDFGDMADGLIAEGYIDAAEVVSAKPDPEPVVAPVAVTEPAPAVKKATPKQSRKR